MISAFKFKKNCLKIIQLNHTGNIVKFELNCIYSKDFEYIEYGIIFFKNCSLQKLQIKSAFN